MADVYAVFGTLLALGIAFPGMLTAWRLLFPLKVTRAQQRLERTPGRALVMGWLVASLVALPIAVLTSLPFGPAKFLGAVLLFGTLTLASLGASGMAGVMAARIDGGAQEGVVALRPFVGGAVILELAAAFPLIGWFVVIPLTLIASLGAAVFALLGWQPAASEHVAERGVDEGSLAHGAQSA